MVGGTRGPLILNLWGVKGFMFKTKVKGVRIWMIAWEKLTGLNLGPPQKRNICLGKERLGRWRLMVQWMNVWVVMGNRMVVLGYALNMLSFVDILIPVLVLSLVTTRCTPSLELWQNLLQV